MSTESDKSEPLTKQYLDQALVKMERFVLDRETSLIWKVIALQITLIGAIAGAQWAALTWMMLHWKP